MYVVSVGGANMDIGGQSFRKLLPADSNPGHVRLSPGGVARNIAHAMSLLNLPCELIAALGDDLYGEAIVRGCQAVGVGTSHILLAPNQATSCYLYITDADGEMTAAISDMALCDLLTPDFLNSKMDFLNAASLVVADANLSRESLAVLARELVVPLFCDPVSVAKAERLSAILPRIHTLKPNRLEAELLSGIPITDESSLRQAAEVLLGRGVQNLYLSLGSKGLYYATATERGVAPAIPVTVRNATGAGDCGMAALARAFTLGLSAPAAARFAVRASSASLMSTDAVPETLRELSASD